MTKTKTIWSCVECGHTQPKWSGQCSQCEGWNTFHEEESATFRFDGESASKPVRLKEVAPDETPRIVTGLSELDRLLGGGLVRGSLSLVGGDPGIGKSTLMLQLSQTIAAQGLVVLYVCGEESVAQTSLRAKRLGVDSENLLLLAETNFSLIKGQIDQLKPDVVIIDSIQIIYKSDLPSAPGSVTQVRESATECMHIAKGRGISIFLIGHVTKSGEIAGPRILEHIVDTVLYFEGDKQLHFRMLRGIKNRFGAIDEIAVFQMTRTGLAEVPNPSQLFLQERLEKTSGSVVIPTLEGSRPLLVEVQALVTDSAYSTPSRRTTGFDQNRLALLLAVLEKRVGFHMQKRDVFVSVAGGIRIVEPGGDLGLLLAIASSLTARTISSDTVILGEVGLGGEIRSVSRLDIRLKEALHLGFKHALVPKRQLKGLPEELTSALTIQGIGLVEEALDVLK